MKDRLYEQRKQQLRQMQDEFEAKQRRIDPTLIPDPLPQRKPPAFLSGDPPLPPMQDDDHVDPVPPAEAKADVVKEENRDERIPEEPVKLPNARFLNTEEEGIVSGAEEAVTVLPKERKGKKHRRIKRVEYYVDSSDSDVDEPVFTAGPRKAPKTAPVITSPLKKKPRYHGVFGEEDETDGFDQLATPMSFEWKRKAQTDVKALERERARATRSIVRERMDENQRQMLMRAVFG